MCGVSFLEFRCKITIGIFPFFMYRRQAKGIKHTASCLGNFNYILCRCYDNTKYNNILSKLFSIITKILEDLKV